MADNYKETEGLEAPTPREGKPYRPWEKVTRTDDYRETVTVEEVENGYIKTCDIEKKVNDSWKYSTKKYIILS